MVCDYLNDEWNKKLMEHCGLTDVCPSVACCVVCVYVHDWDSTPKKASLGGCLEQYALDMQMCGLNEEMHL